MAVNKSKSTSNNLFKSVSKTVQTISNEHSKSPLQAVSKKPRKENLPLQSDKTKLPQQTKPDSSNHLLTTESPLCKEPSESVGSLQGGSSLESVLSASSAQQSDSPTKRKRTHNRKKKPKVAETSTIVTNESRSKNVPALDTTIPRNGNTFESGSVLNIPAEKPDTAEDGPHRLPPVDEVPLTEPKITGVMKAKHAASATADYAAMFTHSSMKAEVQRKSTSTLVAGSTDELKMKVGFSDINFT